MKIIFSKPTPCCDLSAMHRVSAGEENSAAQGRGVDSTVDSSLKACLNGILL